MCVNFRLYLQGTRTIIDNLDAGISVLPVISTYEGVVDCFHTIVLEEGASGLYKGFGALVLDYALQLLLLKIAKVTFQEVEKLFTSSANNKPVVWIFVYTLSLNTFFNVFVFNVKYLNVKICIS